MTIRKKLKVGMGVPLVFFLIFAVVFYLQTRWIGQSLNQIIRVEQPKTEAASQMKISVLGIGFELLGYLRDHDRERLERIKFYKNEFKKNHRLCCSLTKEDEAKLLSAAVDEDYATSRKTAEQIVHLENYQVRKLALLRENLARMDEILEDEFGTYAEPEGERIYSRLDTLVKIKVGAGEVEQAVSRYLITPESEYEQKIYEKLEELARLINAYGNVHPGSRQSHNAEELNSVHAQSITLIREIIALDKRKQSDLEEFVEARKSLQSALTEDIRKANEHLQQARRTSYRAVGISTVITLGLVFVGIVIALFAQAYIAYLTTARIDRLKEAARKISRGKYNTRVEVESDDELGWLADYINKMAEDLKKTELPLNAQDKEENQREKSEVTNSV